MSEITRQRLTNKLNRCIPNRKSILLFNAVSRGEFVLQPEKKVHVAEDITKSAEFFQISGFSRYRPVWQTRDSANGIFFRKACQNFH